MDKEAGGGSGKNPHGLIRDLREKAVEIQRLLDAADEADVLERAKWLSKQGRKSKLSAAHTRAKSKSQDPTSVLISMCKMKETSHGNYSRGSPFVEVEADRSHTYTDVLQLATTAFSLPDEGDKVLSLFRVQNGAAIVDQELSIKGNKVPWTLGSYMLLIKKSPAQTKLGIGYLACDAFSRKRSVHQIPSSKRPKKLKGVSLESGIETGSIQSVASKNPQQTSSSEPVKVTYGKDTPGVGIVVETELERADVWKEEGRDPSLLDRQMIYHPEHDGYQVLRVTRGHTTLLKPMLSQVQVVIGYIATVPNSNFHIAYQSPAEVTVKSFLSPVPLYCISATHWMTKYKWLKIGDQKVTFPSTPAIYVNEVGLYQCQLIDMVDNKTLESAVIAVRVEPGPAVPKLLCSEDAPSASHTNTIILSSSTPLNYHSQEDIPDVIDNTQGKATVAEKDLDQGKPQDACSGLQFSLDALKKATTNFTTVIGRGGFGKVYKGFLHGTPLAVKELSERGVKAIGGSQTSTTPLKQMEAEMTALTRYRHRNLVGLMGYCIAPPMLVYEFMENGSLYVNLHGKNKRTLTWQQRAKILKDACRGLAWLHGSSPPLVHQDIKSANILVDAAYNGKLGDFGFSIEMPQVIGGRTLVTAPGFFRTEGYYLPELSEGLYSTKSDVYSYGVVVLETYSGLKAWVEEREDRRLTEHLQDHITKAEGFSQISDKAAGPCAPYLRLLFLKIIAGSLTKHSKRVYTKQLMTWWNETNF